MIEQHFHALSRRSGDLFQAVICDDSIVVFERHNVRDRGDCDNVKILASLFSAAESFHEFERNACAAQVVKAFSCHFWIDHDAIGDSLLRLVVVGDYGVYAAAFEIFYLVNGSYARVHRDDKRGRVFGQYLFKRVYADSVAVFVAVGDEIEHVELVLQIQHERGYCANAVAVVVAVDEHFFLALYGKAYSLRRFFHSVVHKGGRHFFK